MAMQHEHSDGLISLVSKIIGVDSGPAFDLSRFFGGVFARHTEEELDDFLCQGEGVSPNRPTAEWPSPWVFSRALLFGVLTAAFAYLCGRLAPNNLHVVPLQMFAYTALIPLGVTVLLFELNVHRSISILTALKVFLAGGVVAFVASAFLYDVLANTAFSRALGDSEAGIVEEVVKLLAVLLFVRTVKRSTSALEGIALGALVGMGFAVFESMGYYFRIFLLALVRDSGMPAQLALHNALATAEGNVVLRAWSSPYGHMMFSAIVVGGLFLVKGARPFALGMLWDRRFLRVAMVPVLCHMFWDSNFLSTHAGFVIKLSIIAVIEIATLIVLAGHGLKVSTEIPPETHAHRDGESGGANEQAPTRRTNAIPVKWLVIVIAAWLLFDYSRHDCWFWERKSPLAPVPSAQPPQPQPATSQPAPSQPAPSQPTQQRPAQPAIPKNSGGDSVIKVKMPHVRLQANSQNDPYGRFRINRFQTAALMPMPPNGAIMMLPPTNSGFGPNVNIVAESTQLSITDYAVQFELSRVNEGAVIRGRNADAATSSFALMFELSVKGTALVSYCRVYADGSNRYAVSGVCAKSDWNAYAVKLQNCVNSFTLNGKRGAK